MPRKREMEVQERKACPISISECGSRSGSGSKEAIKLLINTVSCARSLVPVTRRTLLPQTPSCLALAHEAIAGRECVHNRSTLAAWAHGFRYGSCRFQLGQVGRACEHSSSDGRALYVGRGLGDLDLLIAMPYGQRGYHNCAICATAIGHVKQEHETDENRIDALRNKKFKTEY
jgi:hypothetical protein